MGVYAQDQWVHKRLTLTAGLRYDYFTMSSPETSLDAGQFVGRAPLPGDDACARGMTSTPASAFPTICSGMARLPIKASIGRFVASQDGAGTRGLGRNNPVVRSVIETDRTWTDNGNFSVDCDLRNPLLNGECGQISNLNFGQNNPNALVYADELTTSLRPYHWETTAQVQRQFAEGMSITVGYYRRDFANFTVNDNTFVTGQ